MDTGYYNQNHFYKSIDNNPDLVLQHFNLSQQIVYAISNLTFGKEPTISVIDGNKQTAKKLQSQLDDIYSDNKKMPFLLDAARKLSYSGAVGIMLNLNEFVSKYPIMQAYPKENIDVLRTYGRISDIIFKDYYDVGNNKTLTLYSIYGRGYIKYKLVREGYNQATGTSIIEELPLDTLPQTADLEDCYFKYSDGTPYDKIFAVYVENKDGRSSYEGCIDDFISIDENYSQFETFIRNSGLQIYMPEQLAVKDVVSGEILKPRNRAYSNIVQYIPANNPNWQSSEIKRDQVEIINTIQGYINSMKYFCLRAIQTAGLSPFTLGFEDTTNDASGEALNSREKVSIRTRDEMITIWTPALKELSEALLTLFSVKIKGKYYFVDKIDSHYDINFQEYLPHDYSNEQAHVNLIISKLNSNLITLEDAIRELNPDISDEDLKIKMTELNKVELKEEESNQTV